HHPLAQAIDAAPIKIDDSGRPEVRNRSSEPAAKLLQLQVDGHGSNGRILFGTGQEKSLANPGFRRIAQNDTPECREEQEDGQKGEQTSSGPAGLERQRYANNDPRCGKSQEDAGGEKQLTDEHDESQHDQQISQRQ